MDMIRSKTRDKRRVRQQDWNPLFTLENYIGYQSRDFFIFEIVPPFQRSCREFGHCSQMITISPKISTYKKRQRHIKTQLY